MIIRGRICCGYACIEDTPIISDKHTVQHHIIQKLQPSLDLREIFCGIWCGRWTRVEQLNECILHLTLKLYSILRPPQLRRFTNTSALCGRNIMYTRSRHDHNLLFTCVLRERMKGRQGQQEMCEMWYVDSSSLLKTPDSWLDQQSIDGIHVCFGI